jgi:hypothetical protein
MSAEGIIFASAWAAVCMVAVAGVAWAFFRMVL